MRGLYMAKVWNWNVRHEKATCGVGCLNCCALSVCRSLFFLLKLSMLTAITIECCVVDCDHYWVLCCWLRSLLSVVLLTAITIECCVVDCDHYWVLCCCLSQEWWKLKIWSGCSRELKIRSMMFVHILLVCCRSLKLHCSGTMIILSFLHFCQQRQSWTPPHRATERYWWVPSISL